MKVGDLVRCLTALNRPVGLITNVDYNARRSTATARPRRIWVKMYNNGNTYPYQQEQLELVT